jgi:N-acetylglucosaminyldiphosphoundecaprenol N-acetyl-beta-D-mannosaminyltransferase
MTLSVGSSTELWQYCFFGMRVHAISYEEATYLVLQWAQAREKRYVCLANVHMVMEACDSPTFCQIVNDADLVTPDGKPLAWILQHSQVKPQEQVCGRELTRRICKAAAIHQIPIGFYGSSGLVITGLVSNLKRSYPGLDIAYVHSPPFHSLIFEESEAIIQAIRDAGVRILFVGLGCPKQERWMAMHKHRIPAVMVGIGGAFDILAGVQPEVPKWMSFLGLEWLFRLCLEPRRLWYRNLWHSPRFIALLALQIFQLLILLAWVPSQISLLEELDLKSTFLKESLEKADQQLDHFVRFN